MARRFGPLFLSLLMASPAGAKNVMQMLRDARERKAAEEAAKETGLTPKIPKETKKKEPKPAPDSKPVKVVVKIPSEEPRKDITVRTEGDKVIVKTGAEKVVVKAPDNGKVVIRQGAEKIVVKVKDKNPETTTVKVVVKETNPKSGETKTGESKDSSPKIQFKSTGYGRLDEARRAMAPLSALPYWYKYPWQKIQDADAWTLFTVTTLQTHGRELLNQIPQDAEWYCPNYKNLTSEERVMFWVRLVSLLAEKECSFDPAKTYNDVTVGPDVVSSGFLMLSLESARMKPFGCDMIQTQEDLMDWRKNLQCGVRIMNFYFKRDGVISSHQDHGGEWLGLAKYWAPFRDKRLRSVEGRQQIGQLIEERRETWRDEGRRKLHPAYFDSERQNEASLIMFLRLMNQMPFCR